MEDAIAPWPSQEDIAYLEARGYVWCPPHKWAHGMFTHTYAPNIRYTDRTIFADPGWYWVKDAGWLVRYTSPSFPTPIAAYAHGEVAGWEA